MSTCSHCLVHVSEQNCSQVLIRPDAAVIRAVLCKVLHFLLSNLCLSHVVT
jgi:hypothetical protein